MLSLQAFDPQDDTREVASKIVSSLAFHTFFTKEQFRQHLRSNEIAIKLEAGGPGVGIELEFMPWLRYFGNKAWGLVQEAVERRRRLFIPAILERLSKFDGMNPRCVLDALKIEQQRLKNENGGEQVLTGITEITIPLNNT